MKKNKLVLPITILLGCIILGGLFYASQIIKQGSIENQELSLITPIKKSGEENSSTKAQEILMHNPYLHKIAFLLNPANLQTGASWENNIISASFNRAYDVININCKHNQKIDCVRIDRTLYPEEDYYPKIISDNICQVLLENLQQPEQGNEVFLISCE